MHRHIPERSCVPTRVYASVYFRIHVAGEPAHRCRLNDTICVEIEGKNRNAMVVVSVFDGTMEKEKTQLPGVYGLMREETSSRGK